MPRALGRRQGNAPVAGSGDVGPRLAQRPGRWGCAPTGGEGLPREGGRVGRQALERRKETALGLAGGLGLPLPHPDYFGHRWIITDSQEGRAA